MKTLVNICSDLMDIYDTTVLDKLAGSLAYFVDSGFEDYPEIFGNYGSFERNPQVIQSRIAKLHIALNTNDFQSRSWKYKYGNQRRSDNFLVFVSHWEYPNCYQIIDIVSPEAHKKCDKLIPTFIEKAEQFHDLTVDELDVLRWVSME